MSNVNEITEDKNYLADMSHVENVLLDNYWPLNKDFVIVVAAHQLLSADNVESIRSEYPVLSRPYITKEGHPADAVYAPMIVADGIVQEGADGSLETTSEHYKIGYMYMFTRLRNESYYSELVDVCKILDEGVSFYKGEINVSGFGLAKRCTHTGRVN